MNFYDYDNSLPLEDEVHNEVTMSGYSIKHISYASPHGGRVPAYLVVPHSDSPSPAILYLHPGQGNRSTFLAEAEKMAKKGFVSLLIDAPFLRQKHSEPTKQKPDVQQIVKTVTDISQFRQLVVDLRAGIELLISLPVVDAQQISYVGHSYGATWGGVLAGVETRIKSYVLMAGLSRNSEWYRSSEHPLASLVRQVFPEPRFVQFLSELEPMDAVHFISKAAPSRVLFQFARQDDYISTEQAETFINSANTSKDVMWYDTDHLFTNCTSAEGDRINWICKE